MNDLKTKNPDEAQFVGCLLLLLLSPVVYFVNAYTLRTLWQWFLYPQFHWAAPSYAACLGISMIVSFMTQNDTTALRPAKQCREYIGPWVIVAMPFVRCGIVLLAAWIIRHWM